MSDQVPDNAASGLQCASDDDLVAGTRTGDMAAFEELVRRYRVAMTRLAYRFVQNLEDARDCSQDGFVRAYTQLHRYRAASQFDRWLSRIVVNASRDCLRRRRRISPVRAEDLASATPAPGPAPDEAAATAELQSALRRELAALPEAWRVVFALHEQEGLKHGDIAELVGDNVRTVRWRLFKARERLRERLAAFLD